MVPRITSGAPDGRVVTEAAGTLAAVTVGAFASLRVTDYRRFWIGALVSNTGGWMQRVTVPYVLYELTHSAAWVGFAAFVQFMPMVVLGPIGGSVADRFARRNVLLATQTVQALLALVLWALWSLGVASPAVLVGVVALVGVTFGLNGPAWQSFVSELVPRHLLLNAVTLNSTQFNASRALGPALAGIALAVSGPGAAFLLNALSFGAVLIALLAIRPRPLEPRVERSRPFREFADALRYARGVPGIVAAYVVVLALGALGGPLVQLLPVFAEHVFAVGDGKYGLMGAALGVGAIVAAPVLAGPGSRVRRSRLARLAVLSYGTALVVFGLAPGYWFALAALLVLGAGWLTVASTLNTTIQLQVDERMRGKVLAGYLMTLTLAMPVGALVQGWAADTVGPRPTVVVAGLLFLAAAGSLVAAGLLDHLDTADAQPATT